MDGRENDPQVWKKSMEQFVERKMKSEPSGGALKAAQSILDAQLPGLTFNGHIDSVAQIIDEETGLKELIEALEAMLFSLDPFNDPDMTEREIYEVIGEKFGGSIQNAWHNGRKAISRAKGTP